MNESDDEQLHSSDEHSVSARSRSTYRSSSARFLAWLFLSRPALVPPAFRARVETEVQGPRSEKALQLHLREILDRNNEENTPLCFEQLAAADFVAWLNSLERKDGSAVGYSVLNTHRAALFNLYRDHGRSMSPELEKELSHYFKKLKKRTFPNDKRSENDALAFDLYAYFCDVMLKLPGREIAFARACLVLGWNLMCRPASAFAIRHSHLEWKGDALRIYFAHITSGPSVGDRAGDPRHIYANPLRPSVCPVLALGIYWSCNSFNESGLLFPGHHQYDRFRKCLYRLLSVPEVAGELERRGVGLSDLGMHSTRQGAAAYCSSGSTACPSTTAINVRGGWPTGGVQGAYDAAGDMYVGRTVVGLPIGSYEFAVLPPHFPECTEAVRTGVAVTFPGVPRELAYVAGFCLASLVFHVDFIRATVPPAHPIFQTPVFQDPNLLHELSKQVKSGYGGANSTMVATGVPPHVAILSQMKAMQDTTLAAVKKIEAVRADIVRDVVEELERRGAIAARPTSVEQRLRDAITGVLREAGVNELVSASRAAPTAANVVEQSVQERSASPTTETPVPESSIPVNERAEQQLNFFWGGKYRRAPEDFVFPDASARGMWILWRCGNPAAKLPPFKLFESQDMPTRNCQKRLSDARYLMNKIELKLEAIGKQKERLTIEEATAFFFECADAIEVSDTTKTSRKRRAEQLSWKTVASLVRKKHQVSRSGDSERSTTGGGS
ncbi:hypothetical protein FI667_g10578, partial [Globisporangium splendens]